jgi:hypothetical protein
MLKFLDVLLTASLMLIFMFSLTVMSSMAVKLVTSNYKDITNRTSTDFNFNKL